MALQLASAEVKKYSSLKNIPRLIKRSAICGMIIGWEATKKHMDMSNIKAEKLPMRHVGAEGNMSQPPNGIKMAPESQKVAKNTPLWLFAKTKKHKGPAAKKGNMCSLLSHGDREKTEPPSAWNNCGSGLEKGAIGQKGDD